jgi:hypothetical protein
MQRDHHFVEIGIVVAALPPLCRRLSLLIAAPT